MGTAVNEFELPAQCIAPVTFWVHLPDMPAVGAKAFRKKNFAHLVEKVWGGHRGVVAGALGFKEAALVTRYMSSGKSSKPVGEDVARKIELAARAAGAEWVYDGWLDEPHDLDGPKPPVVAGRPGTFEERLNALPEALRRYVLMELEVCERVQHLAPQEFTRPPTLQNRRQFQEYLQNLLSGPLGGRTAA